jgi:hypothetical protein
LVAFYSRKVSVLRCTCPALYLRCYCAVNYIELVDFTGREWHAGKRGRIESTEPKALTKLGLDKDHWTTRVKGIGSGYWRVVGELEELVDKAKEMAQRTLFGTGLARILSKI